MIRHPLIRTCLFFLTVLASPALLSAQEAGAPDASVSPAEKSALAKRADDVVVLLNGDAEPTEIFTPEFLNAVPVSQIEALSAQFASQFGKALSVESLSNPNGARSALTIRMERALAKGGIAIDAAQGNRISELVFRSFDPVGDSKEKIEVELSALPGNVSAYFGPIKGAPGVIAINSEEQMPLGSTMKLYVLAQLGREVAQGKRAWSDVVELDQASFPSGKMQDWPAGSPVTLHTLASMMISISDNTATDVLIRLLGRDTLIDLMEHTAHNAPERNIPWLTTREMFLLKGGNRDRLKAYIGGDSDLRDQILAGIEDEAVSQDAVNAAFSSGPVAINTVEWFANTSDLARLFQVMRAECDAEVFAIMAISPNVPDTIAAKWDYIGYKGGSEPGVLNLTWLLRDKAGCDRMLALSWANPKDNVDTAQLEIIGQRILSLAQ